MIYLLSSNAQRLAWVAWQNKQNLEKPTLSSRNTQNPTTGVSSLIRPPSLSQTKNVKQKHRCCHQSTWGQFRSSHPKTHLHYSVCVKSNWASTWLLSTCSTDPRLDQLFPIFALEVKAVADWYCGSIVEGYKYFW